jgi:hypothetical protein
MTFENMKPDMTSVTLISDLEHPLGSSLDEALSEAREFITFYDWVSFVKAEFLGAGIEGVLYVFLFEIIPTRLNVDSWVWVIVGDLPRAYITCEDAKNPYEAIDAYIGAMEEWVEAAQSGRSVASLIPVSLPATLDNAAMLERRLKFIDEQILPSLR